MDFPDIERDKFKRLQGDEQAIALFDMFRAIRGEIANLKRTVLNFQEDLTHYRTVREKVELNTEQKIDIALGKRFDFWTYFRDKILPSILTVIVLGILYLVFK